MARHKYFLRSAVIKKKMITDIQIIFSSINYIWLCVTSNCSISSTFCLKTGYSCSEINYTKIIAKANQNNSKAAQRWKKPFTGNGEIINSLPLELHSEKKSGIEAATPRMAD